MKAYIPVIKKIIGHEFTNVSNIVNFNKNGTLSIVTPFYLVEIKTDVKFKYSAGVDFNTLEKYLTYFDLSDTKFTKEYVTFEKGGFKGIIPFHKGKLECSSEIKEMLNNIELRKIDYTYRRCMENADAILTRTGSGAVKMVTVDGKENTHSIMFYDITSSLIYFNVGEESPFIDMGNITLSKDLIFPEFVVPYIGMDDNGFLVLQVKNDVFNGVKGLGYRNDVSGDSKAFFEKMRSQYNDLEKGISFVIKITDLEKACLCFNLIPDELATFDGNKLMITTASSVVEIPMQVESSNIEGQVTLFSPNFRRYAAYMYNNGASCINIFGYERYILAISDMEGMVFVEGTY